MRKNLSSKGRGRYFSVQHRSKKSIFTMMISNDCLPSPQDPLSLILLVLHSAFHKRAPVCATVGFRLLTPLLASKHWFLINEIFTPQALVLLYENETKTIWVFTFPHMDFWILLSLLFVVGQNSWSPVSTPMYWQYQHSSLGQAPCFPKLQLFGANSQMRMEYL